MSPVHSITQLTLPLMRYQRAVRSAVWAVIAMNRMSALASLAYSDGAGELHANIAKYKEESEKEDRE